MIKFVIADAVDAYIVRFLIISGKHEIYWLIMEYCDIFSEQGRAMYSHKIILLQNLKNQIMTTNLWVEQVIYPKRRNIEIKEEKNLGDYEIFIKRIM